MTSLSSDISSADALSLIEDCRTQVDTLCAQLLHQMRRTMHPLGFSRDPTEWHGAVPAVLKSINIEYRHDAKVDIKEGARKIRHIKVEWSEFLARLAECTEKGDTIEDLYSTLRALFDDRGAQLPPSIKRQYTDNMLTAEASVKVFNIHLESAQERFTTHQAALEVLCRTAAEVRVFAMRLDNPAARKDNVKGVRPHLADLLRYNDKREELEQQAGVLYSKLTHTFGSAPSIPLRTFRKKMKVYNDILAALKEQETAQTETLKEATVYFDRAASTPAVLTGLWPGTVIGVASLHTAPSQFREILETIELMEELSAPLCSMVTGLTSALRQGVSVPSPGTSRS